MITWPTSPLDMAFRPVRTAVLMAWAMAGFGEKTHNLDLLSDGCQLLKPFQKKKNNIQRTGVKIPSSNSGRKWRMNLEGRGCSVGRFINTSWKPKIPSVIFGEGGGEGRHGFNALEHPSSKSIIASPLICKKKIQKDPNQSQTPIGLDSLGWGTMSFELPDPPPPWVRHCKP